MIQFNLLPDVKLEYIKARRTKRIVVLGSSLIAGVSVAIMVVLFFATNVFQQRHLGNLDTDIKRDSQTLQQEPDLDKILTVQNQLIVMDDLHAKKPAASRFGTYLTQITPTNVSIVKLETDFTTNVMLFEGTAPSLSAVNQFVDTLKFTTYKAGDETDKAFPAVILSSFGRSDIENTGSESPASYKLTVTFNPAIFDITKDTKLQVPKTVTTRSATEKPEAIFESQTPAQEGGNQ